MITIWMSLRPSPFLFALFALLAAPIKLWDSVSVWLHLLEDTPDWLLWIEFSDNPLAGCLKTCAAFLGTKIFCCFQGLTAAAEAASAQAESFMAGASVVAARRSSLEALQMGLEQGVEQATEFEGEEAEVGGEGAVEAEGEGEGGREVVRSPSSVQGDL